MTDTRPRCEVKEKKMGKEIVYNVICPDGSIANNHDHDARRSAERHKSLIDAYDFWAKAGRK